MGRLVPRLISADGGLRRMVRHRSRKPAGEIPCRFESCTLRSERGERDFIMQYQFLFLSGDVVLGFAVGGWFLVQTHKKIKIIFAGGNPSSEGLPHEIVRRLLRLETVLEADAPRLGSVEKISRVSVQKVGFLRFNPFQDTGGDNSFTMILLDGENTGIIFSSLYMRDGTRLYAKEIKNGTPRQPLSAEETRVLKDAIQKES